VRGRGRERERDIWRETERERDKERERTDTFLRSTLNQSKIEVASNAAVFVLVKAAVIVAVVALPRKQGNTHGHRFRA
jgi:hypothetical protein